MPGVDLTGYFLDFVQIFLRPDSVSAAAASQPCSHVGGGVCVCPPWYRGHRDEGAREGGQDPDSPVWGCCNTLNLFFLHSTCAAQLESGWRVQLFRGFCASLWSIQAEHCQRQHPRLSHYSDYKWHFSLSFCQVFF